MRTWVNTLQHGVADPVNAKQWLRRPLAPKTIQNLHGILFAILQDAVEADPPLRTSNPAARTRLPRLDDGEGGDEMVFLTEQEFALIRACAKPDVRDMLTVFVGTGLRSSSTPPRVRGGVTPPSMTAAGFPRSTTRVAAA
ncbi:hypothetical protein [Microbispora sp. H13382]|uniref:hypothetical protein n=1 Tax=Microbispora sp. H13382 TaxID=2729112 RepID=UPI00217617F7